MSTIIMSSSSFPASECDILWNSSNNNNNILLLLSLLIIYFWHLGKLITIPTTSYYLFICLLFVSALTQIYIIILIVLKTLRL